MKVLFKRELGKSGMIKKVVTFNLHVRAELTPEEQALIQKCDADDTVLYTWSGGPKRDIEFKTTVKNMTRGAVINCENFIDLIRAEDELQKACGVFKQLLERAKKFGEEEVVEI
jgi:hypothetical protein